MFFVVVDLVISFCPSCHWPPVIVQSHGACICIDDGDVSAADNDNDNGRLCVSIKTESFRSSISMEIMDNVHMNKWEMGLQSKKSNQWKTSHAYFHRYIKFIICKQNFENYFLKKSKKQFFLNIWGTYNFDFFSSHFWPTTNILIEEHRLLCNILYPAPLLTFSYIKFHFLGAQARNWMGSKFQLALSWLRFSARTE